jgi:hypothetical protein
LSGVTKPASTAAPPDGGTSLQTIDYSSSLDEEFSNMASPKQRAAARRNVSKAAASAKRKKTISKLPKRTRTALGKQAAKVAKRKRRRGAAKG